MVFGPGITTVGCSVTLIGVPLPQVAEYPYLGVTLTTSLSWVPHIRKLISRGHHLYAQSVSWCSSERLGVQVGGAPFHDVCVAERVLRVRVLSWFCSRHAPITWSTTSLGSVPSGVRHRGAPNAAVRVEVGCPDAQLLVTGRLLSLYGRLSSLPMGDHVTPSGTGVPTSCLSLPIR